MMSMESMENGGGVVCEEGNAAQGAGVVVKKKNTIGLVGFIVSLVGWLTAGALCPIGFLLSFIGVFKQPRGFSIAGLIIGGIGSVVGVFVVGGLVLMMFGLSEMGVSMTEAFEGQMVIVSYYQEHGSLPTDGEALLQEKGLNMGYEVTGEKTYNLITPGKDGELGTDDDFAMPGNVNQVQ